MCKFNFFCHFAIFKDFINSNLIILALQNFEFQEKKIFLENLFTNYVKYILRKNLCIKLVAKYNQK